ncbi:winged helix-turn-helix domain-containing protein [Microbulbifer celer]|uniref:Winged helix-turn-helix domain-containing protein n=1 Tax=Microbulbifer celer TaxID=435905 RepID=A0ABW3U6F7_9GAMM|nr:winged helix-turn-helix domain-containing protein [Microbulbifer celer]UFN58601.1 winged helix-turn-helix domain-containing protein [Microbulbifer celer]
MIEAILGSLSAERVLLFITARESGYAAEIAKTFSTDLSPIQKQLDRMERDSLLISQKVGRTRVYSYNPRYPFVPELKLLIEKALSMLPDELREQLELDRRRPRKKGKPL